MCAVFTAFRVPSSAKNHMTNEKPHADCHTFGSLNKIVQCDDRVALNFDFGSLELAATPGGTLLVRIGRETPLPAYRSFAVNDIKYLGDLSVSVTGSLIIVLSERLQVQIRPDAVFDFLWRDGAGITTDVTFDSRDSGLFIRNLLKPDDRVYGLGEKTGSLDKRSRSYRMRNTDVWLENKDGIDRLTDPLYASFPFYIVHNTVGAYGVFIDNAEFVEFDLSGSLYCDVQIPAEVANYHFLPGPTLPDVLRQYTGLTGRMELPALWTLGYHQCRWSYPDETAVQGIAGQLRERQIPADGIWFDIDYMDDYRVFTWNRKAFRKPARLIKDLAADGFQSVSIVDPGIKVEKGCPVYEDGRDKDCFVKHEDGLEYHGKVWPGRCAFPDFHSDRARKWWAELINRWLQETSIEGLWIDMNEPSSVDLSGPIGTTVFGEDRLPHCRARNTYALQMARATMAGMLRRAPDSRPFILTRAAFCGVQTVAAMWSGDNSSKWEHLAESLPMLLNLGLSGVPFVGADIGGFAGDADGELLARWFQVGALYPFCRNHSARGSRHQEPWRFGGAVESSCRKYLELRYRLLPYIYNLFYQAAQTGAPVMRPLAWHYPDDPATFDLEDQFMLGGDILAAPVVSAGQTKRLVYLPEGFWYRWMTEVEEAFEGPTTFWAGAPLDELPLFIRAGAIIPMWIPAQHTAAIDRARVELHIWPGDGQLGFYEDDMESRAYRRGEFRLTSFRLGLRGDVLKLSWAAPRRRFKSERNDWKLKFHRISGGSVILDGQPIRADRSENTLDVLITDDAQGHELILEF